MRKTRAQWLAQASKKHNGKYDYSLVGDDVRHITKLKIICPTHGEFAQNSKDHLSGRGCRACGVESRTKGRTFSYADVVKKARIVHRGEYEYPEHQHIENSHSKIIFTCAIHGDHEQHVYAHLAGKGCPKCGSARRSLKNRYSTQDFIDRACAVHGETYSYPDEFISSSEKIRILCSQHGAFHQNPTSHLQGIGCPKCSSINSKGEKAIAAYVEGLGLSIVRQTKKIIYPLEIDIWVPSRKVGIEYHGLYWHTDERTGREKHRRKYEAAKKAGITLIQVFSDEWENNRKAVEMRIAAILGVSEKYDARKLDITRPSKKQARDFLEGRHTQGAGTTLSSAYALEDEAGIVAIATFGKSRFGNDGWELLRYCSKGRVRGGISRLVTAFVRDHSPKVLVSYADLRWGCGDSYGAANFAFDSVTDPDYWWTDGIERIARYRVQRHKTGMPEKEYAEKNNLLRITGVGHAKWTYTPPQPSPKNTR